MPWWRFENRPGDKERARVVARWLTTMIAAFLLVSYIAWCVIPSFTLVRDPAFRPVVLSAVGLFFLPVAAFIALAAWRWRPVVRGWRRQRGGRCISCGYDRRGL